jgi:hypothetical protein
MVAAIAASARSEARVLSPPPQNRDSHETVRRRPNQPVVIFHS